MDIKYLLQDFFDVNKKLLNMARLSYKDYLINNNPTSKQIFCKNEKIKEREFCIQLPHQIIGDIQNLTPSQKDLYINVLKNSVKIDEHKNISRVGILKELDLFNTIKEANNEFSKDLNIANQRAAKHIVGLTHINHAFKVPPYSTLCEYIGTLHFIKAFTDGTLDKQIKNAIGKIYNHKRSALILESLDKDIPRYYSDEDIIYSYNKCKDRQLPLEQKFVKFIHFVGTIPYNINNDFMATQLLERGFIWCESIDEYNRHFHMYGF